MDARDDAAAAANRAGVSVRRLVDGNDAEAALELMWLTWGEGQPFPSELMRAMEASGDLVLGAFDDTGLVGFTLGFYADGGGMHFHSHMLAVRPESQRRGVGYALKLAQRSACLDAGVEVMRWTFDPLQARNAAFNLEKLGAVAESFSRDFYGSMLDSQSLGDRGDRLWARWDLTGGSRPEPPADALRIAIPADYWDTRERDTAAAQAIRDRVADELEAAFATGAVGVGFRDGGYVFA